MLKERLSIMAVHHFNLEDIGEQTMYWWQGRSGSTSTPVHPMTGNLPNLTPMHEELILLQKRFAEQRRFQNLCTFVLALSACISIGLSLWAYLLAIG